ncbi:MAG: ABC transporter ATP-binding protein [Clostridia bacterium]|jgi:iron complex transport system ATP-binding protein|nr:ABC transporter ATP-binding protein [Clostridia bacterium]
MKLDLKNVSCGYGKRQIINNVCLSIHSGEILCLLGPNGVGKTTLFKSILGFLPLLEGEVLLNERPTRLWTQKALAKAIGYVPQAHDPPFPYKVFDVVLMGRTAHIGAFSAPSKEDRHIAEEALEIIGISYLKDKIYTEISGGERQMVLIARALTQTPEFLVLDEPTSNLDFGNQMCVLEQINKLAVKGLGVVMTSHFPNHAFLCATKAALIHRNSLITVGPVDEVVSEENLRSAYGVEVKITSAFNSKGECVKACIPMLSA